MTFSLDWLNCCERLAIALNTQFFSNRDWPALFAFLIPALITLACGNRVIAWLREHCAEPIRTGSDRLNEMLAGKRATPTLGGVLLFASFAIGCLLTIKIQSPILGIVLFPGIAFGALGFWDDWTKLTTSRRGIPARTKIVTQTVFGLCTTLLIYSYQAGVADGLERTLPLLGQCDLGLWLLPLTTLFIVGFSNAVNLTDGLDGLAAGCSVALLAAFLVAGGAALALEPALLHASLALIGALVGFLWFNRHPARVFMGNTGSAPLGALLTILAVLMRLEWVLAVGGAVFVAEAASVILQVGYFRWRGRRLLRCAPLHHHFQFAGWNEPRIVRRFWLAAAVCATLAVVASALPNRNDARMAGRRAPSQKKLSQEQGLPPEIR